MRRVFALTGGVLVLCAILIGGTRALARRDPPAHVQALLPDPSCPAPCWQGLRPGYSTQEEIADWVQNPPDGWQIEVSSQGTEFPCQMGFACYALPSQTGVYLATLNRSPTEVVLMLTPSTVTLGDVLVALGKPDAIGFNLGPLQSFVDFRLYYLKFYLTVSGQVSIHGIMRSPDDPDLTPTTRIFSLQYQAQPMSRPLLAFDWRGFGSLARYYPDGIEP